VARDLGEVLRKGLNNQTVIIENVGGAGGTLGAAKVAKASPDGYTLLLHHIGMATSPALYRNLPFKVLDDFEYLGVVNDVPMTLLGSPKLPANTYRDFEAYIRANGVPYNKLHDRGYPSIGCAPCTRAIQPGEDVRAGRWWWESPETKECGLHVVDGQLKRKTGT